MCQKNESTTPIVVEVQENGVILSQHSRGAIFTPTREGWDQLCREIKAGKYDKK